MPDASSRAAVAPSRPLHVAMVAPPYFTIFLVGHVLVPPVFWIEKAYEPPMWLHMVVWLPLFTILCMLLLRPIKGGVVGWMSTLGIDQEVAAPAAVRVPDRNA